MKFNFLCSAYFWIPCTVQIAKNIFLDFSSFAGVINARAKLRNELFILLRFYYVIIHIRRGLRKVCAVRHVTSTMWEGQESAQLQLSRRKAW